MARLSTTFAQIVAVLMRSLQRKHLALVDLEWLMLPALAKGQFGVANVQTKDGVGVPAAVVPWASVSPDVDQKLSQNLTALLRLRPDEWKSGDIPAVGGARAVPGLLKQLSENVKGRERGEDGKPIIGTLTQALQPSAA